MTIGTDRRAANRAVPYLGGSDQIPGRESRVGQYAPAFQLKDESDTNVSSRLLLRRQPVLLHFYRGAW